MAHSTDLVAIVATDWVESTATRASLGEDRADELQREHDVLLREVVAEFGGTVAKHSGDGMLATFHSATAAVGASIRVQQRVASYSLSAKAIAPLALRIGISVGDVVHQDGDMFGTPVVEAVRLEGAAEPRQVLCSELVQVLARGRGGYTFDFIGMLELKGLPEPVAACAVRWETEEDIVGAIPLPPELITEGSRFVGRDKELQLAAEMLIESERAQALWLLGEPGIGKTRLAAEIANRAFDAGATVLFGRCGEDIAAPFEPVIQALRWYVAHATDDELGVVLGGDAEPLARLVPELRTRLPDLPVDVAPITEGEQYRLFDAARSWVVSCAATRPLVWVVDDAHWADRPTLSLLAHVLRGAHGARVFVIGTARDTAPDMSPALADLVDELEISRLSNQVRLDGLSAEQIGTLVEGSGGAGIGNDEALAERLAVETAGNPLFVGAVLSALTSSAGVDGVADMPTDVRSAVRRRVRRLTPEVQQLLQVASLVGLEFALGLVADATATDEARVLSLVEEAVSAGLVHETSVDRFRFTHALVRDSLAHELSASRRARLHVVLAQSIEARYADRLDEHAGALARHYASAGEAPALRKALDYAQRSAQRSLDLLAFDAAAEDYDTALALSEQLAQPAHDRFELLIAKGHAQRLASAHAPALATLATAADLARDVDDWEGFARASVAFEDANWRTGELGHEAVRLLREASRHADQLPTSLRVVLAASLGRALHYAGRAEEAVRIADGALVEARAGDDPEALAHALAATVQVRVPVLRDEFPIVRDRAEELFAMREQLADIDPIVTVAEYATSAYLVAGDAESASRWRERMRILEARQGSRFSHFVLICGDEIVAFLHGDLERAETLANDAVEFGRQTGEDVSGVHGVQMFLIRREQDRLAELAPVVRLFLKTNPDALLWRPGLVLLLAEIGLHDEARAQLAQLAADNFAALPRDNLFPAACCFVAETAVQIDDRDAARGVAKLLEPWSGLGVSLGHFVGHLGAADRYLALLQSCFGDADGADALFEAAIAWNRRVGAVVWVAHTLVDRVGLLQELGQRSAAESLAREARALAERHSLIAVGRRLDAISVANDR